MSGQAPDTSMRIGTGEAIPGHNHISTDTKAQVIMIHIEDTRDHGIGIIATTTGVAHYAQILTAGVIAIDPAVTHIIDHTTDHPCTEAYHTTPEIGATSH